MYALMGRGRTSDNRLLRRYATRMARLCFLRHRCSPDHPILSAEAQLVDMARSKLQEELLARSSVDALGRMRPGLESEIRRMAEDWVRSQPMDEPERTFVLEAVDGEDLDRLFLFDS